MVPVNIDWGFFRHRGVKPESDAPLQFRLEAFRRPALFLEEEFEPGRLAALAQDVRVAEDLRDPLDYRNDLVPPRESIKSHSEVRVGGESAADSRRKADFRMSIACAGDRRQANIVDFRIGAPDPAASDADFIFARQVVKRWVAHQQTRRLQDKRRSVTDFVGIHPSEQAASDVARVVAAGAHRGQATPPELPHQMGQGLDGDPVELEVLSDSEVGHAAGVLLRQARNGAQLMGEEQPARKSDTNHNLRHGFPLAACATKRAKTVSLRVNPPPTEVGAQPFGWDRNVASASEVLDLGEALPGILLPLEALDPLGLRLFGCCFHG